MELVNKKEFLPLTNTVIVELEEGGKKFVVANYDGEELEFSEHSSREEAEKNGKIPLKKLLLG